MPLCGQRSASSSLCPPRRDRAELITGSNLQSVLYHATPQSAAMRAWASSDSQMMPLDSVLGVTAVPTVDSLRRLAKAFAWSQDAPKNANAYALNRGAINRLVAAIPNVSKGAKVSLEHELNTVLGLKGLPTSTMVYALKPQAAGPLDVWPLSGSNFNVAPPGKRLGFFYTTCSQQSAMEKVLSRCREHYPTEFIYLYSDCAYDFSDVAKKYNCHYAQRAGDPDQDGAKKSKLALQSSYGMGYNQYGMGVNEWLGLWRDAASLSDADWLVHLEDDVITRKRHDPELLPGPEIGIAGPICPHQKYMPHLLNYLKAKAPASVARPLIDFYNGMGASLVSTKAIKELTPEAMRNIDFAEIHYRDPRVMRATDATINVALLMLGYGAQVWKDASMPTYETPDLGINASAAFEHGDKEAYTASNTHADVMPWQAPGGSCFGTSHNAYRAIHAHPEHPPSALCPESTNRHIIVLNGGIGVSMWEYAMRMQKLMKVETICLETRVGATSRLRGLHHETHEDQAHRGVNMVNHWLSGETYKAPIAVVAISDVWGSGLKHIADAIERHNSACPAAKVHTSFVMLHVDPSDFVQSEYSDAQLVYNSLVEYSMLMKQAPLSQNRVTTVTRQQIADIVGEATTLYGFTKSDNEQMGSEVLRFTERRLGLDEANEVKTAPAFDYDLVINLSSPKLTSMYEVSQMLVDETYAAVQRTQSKLFGHQPLMMDTLPDFPSDFDTLNLHVINRRSFDREVPEDTVIAETARSTFDKILNMYV